MKQIMPVDEKLDHVRKALQESEQRYQSLVDSIPDIVFTLNENGGIISVNNEFVYSLGYPREEILKTPIIDIIHPEDRSKISAAIKVITATGQVIRGLECRIMTRNGAVTYHEINQCGIYGLAGELLYIQGLAHDISERRKAEERITHLKEFNESIFNSIRSGIVVVDPNDSKVIMANRSYLKQVGLAEEAVVGHKYDEINQALVRPAGSPCCLSLLKNTLESGGIFEMDCLRSLDGLETRHFEIATYPIKNQKNEITEIILIERDVTDRRRIEDELKNHVTELSILRDVGEAIQSTLNLDEILHTLLVGVTAGQGLSFNRAFLFLLNQEEGVLEGALAIGPANPEEAGHIWEDLDRKHLSFTELLRSYGDPMTCPNTLVNQVVHKIRIPVTEDKNTLITAMMEGKSFNVIEGLIEGDPTRRIEDDLATRLSSKDFAVVPLYSRSKRIGVLIADNMITRTPIIDQAINSLQIFANHASSAIENSRLYGELEKKYYDLERANNLIREKRAELLEAERLSTVGRMANILAHEVRNPLVVIGGFARSLKEETPPDDPKRDELSIILSETMRLEELVRNVLEYAKFAKPKIQPVSVSDLVRQVVDMVKYELRANHIHFKVDVDEDLPPISADENQMRQVFLNLLFNAIHAMTSGGDLGISAARSGNFVEIKVADSGCGIAEANINKIFSPFFTTKTRGSGLGLHLVSQIISEHGGRIVVASEEDRGTVFTIYIPFA
ncbi:MAG: PAS domain S-box protein [Acidobacteria bacterium]|nr:PAS domain S-box protein [Acidobacteriota bacterium]MBI3654922.1 PAS domain S-box protein [Acidobacteriota bacterium]